MENPGRRASRPNVTVHAVDQLSFAFAPWVWPFAERRRPEIQEFFKQLCVAKPTLWNGGLLLLRDVRLAGGAMSGTFFETDYASMLAAVTWDAMGERVRSCFPAAAVLSADGAFMLGEMAAHTQNAGQVRLPCGSVERGDVVAGRLDPSTTLHRELLEETGISADELIAAPDWRAVEAETLLPLVKVLRSADSAEELGRRIAANLAGQRDPEFCRIAAVRGPADLNERMPRWVLAFLQHFWIGSLETGVSLAAGATG